MELDEIYNELEKRYGVRDIGIIVAKLEDEKKVFEKNQKTLMTYIGKVVNRNQENVSVLLDINEYNLIKVLKMKRDVVYEELHSLDDGEYISRNSLLYALDEVVNLLGEHETISRQKEKSHE